MGMNRIYTNYRCLIGDSIYMELSTDAVRIQAVFTSLTSMHSCLGITKTYMKVGFS